MARPYSLPWNDFVQSAFLVILSISSTRWGGDQDSVNMSKFAVDYGLKKHLSVEEIGVPKGFEGGDRFLQIVYSFMIRFRHRPIH